MKGHRSEDEGPSLSIIKAININEGIPYKGKFPWSKISVISPKYRCEPYKFPCFCALFSLNHENHENFYPTKIILYMVDPFQLSCSLHINKKLQLAAQIVKAGKMEAILQNWSVTTLLAGNSLAAVQPQRCLCLEELWAARTLNEKAYSCILASSTPWTKTPPIVAPVC